MIFDTYDVFIDNQQVYDSSDLLGKRLLNKRGHYFTVKEVLCIYDDSIKVSVNESDNAVILMEKYFQNVRFIRNYKREFVDYLESREILFVLHFTDIMNLESILNQGLLTKDLLDSNISIYNDKQRFDGTDAICLSVSFPNYKMFYKCRDDNPEKEWCIISLKPDILYELDCGFFHTNAASKIFRNRSKKQYKGLSSFKRMFPETFVSKFDHNIVLSRNQLKLPDYYTTDPQAEVLVFETIPTDFISHVFLSTDTALKYFSEKYPEYNFILDDYYFRPRFDHENW